MIRRPTVRPGPLLGGTLEEGAPGALVDLREAARSKLLVHFEDRKAGRPSTRAESSHLIASTIVSGIKTLPNHRPDRPGEGSDQGLASRRVSTRSLQQPPLLGHGVQIRDFSKHADVDLPDPGHVEVGPHLHHGWQRQVNDDLSLVRAQAAFHDGPV